MCLEYLLLSNFLSSTCIYFYGIILLHIHSLLSKLLFYFILFLNSSFLPFVPRVSLLL
ncbi:hypothetical protein F5Y11DRAFT_316020 [Daldinia sp. FL1419]|nr:hypothetical protein F5Y11DRAFT_316020 [Daldinia sp. FL1419]